MSAYSTTIDDPRIVDPDKHKIKVLIACFLGYAMDALDMMVMALALPLIVKAFNISLVAASSIAVATNLGAAIGAILWGPIADKIGRRKALIICISWFTVWAVLCGFANNVTTIAIFRFIAGLGLGGEWAVGAALLTEFWPADKRAWAAGICQSSWAFGYFLALGVNISLVPIFGWRILFWSASLGVICLIMLLFVPESPVWLTHKDEIIKGNKKKVGIMELLAPDVRKNFIWATLLCVGAMVSYWGLGTFMPTLLKDTRGLDNTTMSYILMVTYAASFFGYYFFAWIAERFGRRNEMIIGSIVGVIMTFIFLNMEGGWVYLIVAIMGFVSPGYWSPLSAFLAELSPTRVRASFIGITFGIGKWVIIVVPYAVSAIAATKGLTFALYITTSFFLLVTISAFLLKETKGTEITAD